MATSPRVTVVTTVRDGARFVDEAVASVLRQSLAELELRVVDDGSTDDTAARLAEWARRDGRVLVRTLPRPVGTAAAANLALREARGDFVARLDADDVCRPDRLAEQVAALTADASLGLVGSRCLRIDEAGQALGEQPVPLTHEAIALRCVIGPPLVHSTVTWRRALGLTYDDAWPVAGDFELWVRALPRVRAINLSAPLVAYRQWAGGITGTRRAEQRARHQALGFAALGARWPHLAGEREAYAAWRAVLEGAVPTAAGARLGREMEALAGPTLAEVLRAAPGALGQPGPAPEPGSSTPA